ncbi:MAG: hypothetical protein JXA25_12590 [Anaerolineales bacterium]|nr:hypothetical protein [Anaerolineales bacterium]
MREKLIQAVEAFGIKTQVVSVQHLDDLRQTIEGLLKEELLDEGFYMKYLAGFVFEPPEELREARSLIAAALPDPQIRLHFNWKGVRFPVLVPPTYLHWRERDTKVEEVLSDSLRSKGYRITQAKVPKKLLAVCSGLAAYGKNNITYIEGMGSFHRLAAYYSDLECDQDNWREPVQMDRCTDCIICRQACPTGAIAPDRFLLNAEKCITFWNEKSGEIPFPDWMEASWHNSLVGCMHCQSVCPANRQVRDWIEEGVEFSEEQTDLLTRGVPKDELPAELLEKLDQSDLLEWFDLWPRNLQVHLDRVESHLL